MGMVKLAIYSNLSWREQKTKSGCRRMGGRWHGWFRNMGRCPQRLQKQQHHSSHWKKMTLGCSWLSLPGSKGALPLLNIISNQVCSGGKHLWCCGFKEGISPCRNFFWAPILLLQYHHPEGLHTNRIIEQKDLWTWVETWIQGLFFKFCSLSKSIPLWYASFLKILAIIL